MRAIHKLWIGAVCIALLFLCGVYLSGRYTYRLQESLAEAQNNPQAILQIQQSIDALQDFERAAMLYETQPTAAHQNGLVKQHQITANQLLALRGYADSATVDTILQKYNIMVAQTNELTLWRQQARKSVEQKFNDALTGAGDSLLNDTTALRLFTIQSTTVVLEKPIIVEVPKRKKKRKGELEYTQTEPQVVDISNSEFQQKDSVLVRKVDSVFTGLRNQIGALRSENQKIQATYAQQLAQIASQRAEIYTQVITLLHAIRQKEQASIWQQNQNAMQVANQSRNSLVALFLITALIAVLFIAGIVYDVTQSQYFRRKAEQEQQKALALAQAREQFLMHISHEIRTPLHGIQGFVEQLRPEIKSPLLLDALQSATHHLLVLVNNVLDFAKLQKQDLIPQLHPVDIAHELETLKPILAVLASRKNLEFTCTCQVHPSVETDVLWWKQIVYNLVGNAIKFTQAGHVAVNVFYEHGSLHVRVTDTGPGISKAAQATIFEAFETLQAASPAQAGTGLGLTITQKLVHGLGGSISMESEPGKGSIFKAQWPALACDVPLAEQTPNLQAKRWLIVDDEPGNRLLTQSLLLRWGAEVFTASTGAEGLSWLSKMEFDGVLLDIHMDDMNGIAMMQHYLSHHPNSPVRLWIVSSAASHTPELPANLPIRFLAKPFTIHALSSLIQNSP